MIPAKQEALESIRKLPDDADMEAIMYQLYVIDKARKGQDAVNKGQLTTSEELLRERLEDPELFRLAAPADLRAVFGAVLREVRVQKGGQLNAMGRL
jgi:hypothetical protein